MLTLSHEAAALIRSLVDDADLPDSAGLRVSTDPERQSLAMSLAARPEDRDVVVSRAGAALFVCPTAADRLRGRTLDAQLEDRPAFWVA